MKFFNQTDWPAELFRTEMEKDGMYNSLLARTRYRLTDNSTVVPVNDSGDKLVNIRRTPIETEYGTIDPDLFFPRTGTDLIIIGDAVSSSGPVYVMDVTVNAGPYNQRIRIFGDRFWHETGNGELSATRPTKFEKFPITYNHAFGGRAEGEYGDLPFYKNPIGKGFYLSKKEAVGKPLPNIEDPKNLIKKWNDQPDPVGFSPYPQNWGLRLEKLLCKDDRRNAFKIKLENGAFDKAHPKLSGKYLEAGQKICIEGMSSTSAIVFVIPKCPFETVIRLGETVCVRDLFIEEILFDQRKSIVDISFRKYFDYKFVPNKIRTTTLRYKNGASRWPHSPIKY